MLQKLIRNTALATFLLLAFFSLHTTTHAAPADDFVTTWKTDNPGTSNSTSITIDTIAGLGFNYDVDWDKMTVPLMNLVLRVM